MSRRMPIFYSALMLTAVNLLLRLVGTLFQVYLSRRIGAAGIGLLQLVMSVGSMTLVAGMAGVRTSTMYLTAEELGKGRRENVTWVLSGSLHYSLLFSGTVAAALIFFAPRIADSWIGAPETAPALRLYGAVLPLTCLCGVMTGYFTAANRIGTLAIVEVGEQLVSMGVTMTALTLWAGTSPARACLCVILGSGVGACLTLGCLVYLRQREIPTTSGISRLKREQEIPTTGGISRLKREWEIPTTSGKTNLKREWEGNPQCENPTTSGISRLKRERDIPTTGGKFHLKWEREGMPRDGIPTTSGKFRLWHHLLETALPLAVADDLKTGINTVENLMVPKRLALCTLVENPLASFGVVSGMVFPVLMFPSCILFALAELLIPELARCAAAGSEGRIRYLVKRSLKVALLYGIFFCGLEFLSAQALCQRLYDNPEAGRNLGLYALLIPMLYCDLIVDAMIKGLGQQKISVRYNILTSALDVIFLYLLLPRYGMTGYFVSFFVTHLINFVLSLRRLLKITHIRIPGKRALRVLPVMGAAVAGAGTLAGIPARLTAFALLLGSGLCLCGITGKEDLRWLRGLISKQIP